MISFDLGNAPRNTLGTKAIENNYDYNEKEYIYDENKPNDGHTAVARLVDKKSRVLDAGCASGILGYILSNYKECVVDGIEYDVEAYEVAKNKKIYKNIYNFSVTDSDNKTYNEFFNNKDKYDYIIFADVLEHLDQPWEVINNFFDKLKTNGKMIVCIPNIAHIDIINGLLNGKFNYNRFGILDSTHLRFFTVSSFYDMINNINKEHNKNYKVELKDQIKIKPEYFSVETFHDIGLSYSDLEQLLVLQNVFVIFKSDKKVTNKYSGKMHVDKAHYTSCIQDIIENNAKLINENKELRNQVNLLLNSNSWRLTKPLRKLRHLFDKKR